MAAAKRDDGERRVALRPARHVDGPGARPHTCCGQMFPSHALMVFHKIADDHVNPATVPACWWKCAYAVADGEGVTSA